GTQANLWTESCTSNREAEYQYYPRLLALSEIAWLPTSKKNFLGFYKRLQHHEAVLQAKNITYAPHYFEPKELTPAEAAIAEAEDILANSNPGAVGYPSAAEADALRSALDALRSVAVPEGSPEGQAALSALNSQLSTYKSAPIILPKADCLYKIVSASTYFSKRFNGSSLYVKDNTLALHYTQQTEPEELWQFVPQDDGSYQIVSVLTGNAINISTSNGSAVRVNNASGSNLVIRKATKPSGTYTYIPGVVNIKRSRYNLYANLSGRDLTLVASTDSALCYPGTWRIEEITDYRPWVEKIVAKAEIVLEEATPGLIGQPTVEALEFLQTQVLDEARMKLNQGTVSQQDYLDIAARYAQFMSMERTTPLGLIDPAYYYLIRNVYFDTYYASDNPNTSGLLPKTLGDGDTFRWRIDRHDDGTVGLINKATETPAYVASDADEQRVKVGQDYAWKLAAVTTDQNQTGIGILSKSGTYSWYTNPRSWTYILLKPYEWGGSIWEFVKTDEEVTTAINEVSDGTANRSSISHHIFDLTGRRLSQAPVHGIYIQDRQKRCN
ncbi:MAG: family 20 glycosylhydrolase, partial [Bacteroidaceae bacterium]|nr:family 20 glycosylhydrolase [Bacteroidaceae bacterium]